jgi:hypothetical protein
VLIPDPQCIPRHTFVSHSHRGSRHDVRDPYQICPTLFFLKELSAPTDSKVDQGNGSSHSPFPHLLCRLCIGSFPSSSPLYSSTRSTTVSRRASAMTTLPLASYRWPGLVSANYRQHYCCRCSTTLFSSTSVWYSAECQPRALPRITRNQPCELTRLPEF